MNRFLQWLLADEQEPNGMAEARAANATATKQLEEETDGLCQAITISEARRRKPKPNGKFAVQ
jgi:hypothetical protein